jgi:23S rRNA pseudouridine1911/1915/1917 synthase
MKSQTKFIAPIAGTLLEVLQAFFTESSNQKLRKMIKYSHITAGNRLVKLPTDKVHQHEEVHITPQEQSTKSSPIVYEDDALIIIHKPSGLLTSVIGDQKEESCYSLLFEYFKQTTGGKVRPFAVHRLDREVSGLLMFAKSEEIQEKLKDQWRDVKKHYYALVEGRPKEKIGVIDTYLKESTKQKMLVTGPSDDAKRAITHYEIAGIHGPNTLLRLELETGRKNQLRVHLSHKGWPIVGDYRYGADGEYRRQIRLFAYFLKFKHPQNGKEMSFSLPLPKNFLSAPKKDENYKRGLSAFVKAFTEVEM